MAVPLLFASRCLPLLFAAPSPFCLRPAPFCLLCAPSPFCSRVALPPPFVRVPLRLRGGGRGGGGGGRIRHRPAKPMGSPRAGSNPAPSSFCSRPAPSPFCSRPAPSPFRSRPAPSPFCSRPAPSARWGSGSLRAGSSPAPFRSLLNQNVHPCILPSGGGRKPASLG